MQFFGYALGVEFDGIKGKGPTFAAPVRTAEDIRGLKVRRFISGRVLWIMRAGVGCLRVHNSTKPVDRIAPWPLQVLLRLLQVLTAALSMDLNTV